ncbi:MAG: class I SAM-dependent methyltransferase [Lutibacter sp.]|nr:class I SAM-dependent methyltransferase [Lutibacter sp.]
MNLETLKQRINGVDIYILDQILKDLYQPGAKILDAGCGNGRNLKWFYKAGFEIHGTEIDQKRLQSCKDSYPQQKNNFIEAFIEQMPYESNSFDHLICIAVLHFANDLEHYLRMLNELLRILKPQGSLLIRTATNVGIENEVQELGDSLFKFPDGTTRFLLTAEILKKLELDNRFIWLENVKTTIVHNKRAMTTLVLQKVI